MSSTSLILLAMYSVVNVVNLGSSSLTPGNQVFLIVLLLAAVSLAVAGMLLAAVPKQRIIRKGPPRPPLQRRIHGPAARRH